MTQQSELDYEADACVIGAGPVGLKLATDLANLNLSVLLVDAGAANAGLPSPAAFPTSITNPRTHAPYDEVVRQGLGGTSDIWGGRCIPFSGVDFQQRALAADGQWPIGLEQIEPWYSEASAFLGCGSQFAQDMPTARPDELQLDQIERWCAEPRMKRLHMRSISSSGNIKLLLNRVITKLHIDPLSGLVSAATASSRGEADTLRAKLFVVAAGGLESARLLLSLEREYPTIFGGRSGCIGRYYMGHLSGSIARIIFRRPGLDQEFLFRRSHAGSYTRRYIKLSDSAQQQHRLLNMSARPELPHIHDAAHRSGILSLPYLALRMPWIGPKLLAEPIRSRKLGPPGTPIMPHMLNVLRDPGSAIGFGMKFLKARFFETGRIPGIFFTNPGRSYVFHYHAEQTPSKSSRVSIKSNYDEGLLPELQVDLKFQRSDAESVVKSHDLIDKALREQNLGELDYHVEPSERVDAVLAQAADGAHQIGTLRMSSSCVNGVVDENCKVHGFKNLFAVGSSVFPTSSHANPTFLAVALAARLAQHIPRVLAPSPVTVPAE